MSENTNNKSLNKCEVTSQLNECDSHHHDPHVSRGKVLSKIPVVLAQLNLQMKLDAKIEFPEPVLEIKDIKKQVKLTQCRLLLPSNKLFVKGFVRKNIQYASPCTDIENNTTKSVASDLHSYTVDIPFDCVTEVKKYLSMPVMPEVNNRQEFDFMVSKPLGTGFPEKDKLLTNDLSQFHQESSQFYNELPFCELISSKIIEWDEAVDRVSLPGDSPLGEGYFKTIEEKMVVDICIKVLQKQNVRISSHHDCHDDCD
ncbi:CsxC family protein [Pontibacillus sp. HMF3514]|uniref:CsxC family protein n=1 Tax=Pontibacillus sp. HMF3514 TaxID=2692425 RepID=UPI0013205528|nr:DUF3794 domain-containing protein [Pontibacillus sp. HMF3514]QHE52622.1 DUF3794 domain-containing protein [Pontibacillus sp. HMF3514]